MQSLDSFKCRKTLKVGSKSYVYFSLTAAEKNGLKGVSRLPHSMRVLLENLLRHQGGGRLVQDAHQRPRDRLPAGARADAGSDRRARGGGSGGDARCHEDAG